MEPLREAQIGKPKLDLVFECARAHAMRDVLVEFMAASPPDYCPTMNILIKRVYEEPDADDGTRILVDRLWPRGLSKEKARVDLWLKDVAPSTNLRKWFAHDPANWKISHSDYKKRALWDDYTEAFEDVFAETSTKDAPWYIIPSNHKWFRNLVVSQIVAATMEDLGMRMPEPQVDLKAIRKEYHQAAAASAENGRPAG